jgi:hypothetical protein
MQLEKIDLERLKQIKQQSSKEVNAKKTTQGQINCNWCKQQVNHNGDFDHFYQCDKHNTIFCDSCAKNFFQDPIDKKFAPCCLKAFYLTDFATRMNLNYNPEEDNCIYKKRSVENNA